MQFSQIDTHRQYKISSYILQLHIMHDQNFLKRWMAFSGCENVRRIQCGDVESSLVSPLSACSFSFPGAARGGAIKVLGINI